jgi:hypothetical protein
MATPEPIPAPVVPPTPAPAHEPPAPAPSPAPAPAGTRSAAEIENDLLKERLASRDKDKDLHSLKEKNRKLEDQNTAARAALKASGFITGDDVGDPKAILEKQEKDARSKERRENAVERAATRKLLGSSLGEEDADLIIGKLTRDSRVTFDEATGSVSGLDEVFTALKPTIDRLSVKGPTPPVPAPPVPPNPKSGATPLDGEFAEIKTWSDLMAKPISFQERFEQKHPNEFRSLETMFHAGANRGRPIAVSRPLQPVSR